MWTPFNFFISAWKGSGQGRPGHSYVERKHEFVLKQKWQAIETYQILGPEEFVEIFELAVPDKDFKNYSEGHFQRVHAE